MGSPATEKPRLLGPLLVVAGLLFALGLPVGWLAISHSTGNHQLRPGTAADLSSGSAGPSPSTAQPPVGAKVPVSKVPVSKATVPVPRAVPVRLRIPSLSIDVPVVAEGVSPDGQLAIPADIHTIGWYRWGQAPGAASGSVVLVGHVDSATAGEGSFFTLKDIRAGVDVTVITADGASHRYHVLGREEFAKTNVPLRQIFAKTGEPRLTLVTCGGKFDARTRSYADNIVVTAVP